MTAFRLAAAIVVAVIYGGIIAYIVYRSTTSTLIKTYQKDIYFSLGLFSVCIYTQ